ncbi:MAG TPA: hypothetical protein VMP11_16985 [Verrucomicrobiae bacterium]|nr:hypothetical protein [Verrucomicrobiae bacterium]
MNRSSRFLTPIIAVLFLATTTFAGNLTVNGNPTTVPVDVLQLLQKQAASPPWNKDAPEKRQRILHQCAALQQLLTTGATDAVLSNALAASTMRASIFMTFGNSLYTAGDRHHAEMFFNTVVCNRPTHATAKELARCHLWLGKLYQEDGLAAKYQQGNAAEASTLFQNAADNYLAAKEASKDWVRSSGWLGAAQCYRELGQHPMCRLCLSSLLEELGSHAFPLAGADVALGLARRDIATHMLATSFYEDHRYAEAAQVWQQLRTRITAQVGANSPEYPGQATYLGLATTGLNQCAARQADPKTTNPSSSTEVRRIP